MRVGARNVDLLAHDYRREIRSMCTERTYVCLRCVHHVGYALLLHADFLLAWLYGGMICLAVAAYRAAGAILTQW